MLARIAYSLPASEEDLAVRTENLQKRFKPALIKQPGLVAAFWLAAPDGRRGSITIWESEELMQAAGRAANAVPLLPGHQAEQLPGPEQGQVVEVMDVFDHHFGAAPSGG